MSYQALYRAWRPQTFEDLIGQPHVRQTLMNAMQTGQVAHAYLFCGPRGTGKTSAAKVLAKAVNCLNPQGTEPCNQCEACLSITNGSNVDVEEIDAASNRGVDEIRQLRDKVQYAPASVMKKVYIVDEVHMLTTEAFNALLKTLEEPPSHTLFILATTEPHKIPATIVSRCQRFDFRRIEPELIITRLRAICDTKGWRADDEALWRIAEAADGGLRDALGLLEQTAAFAKGDLTAEAAAHVMGGVQAQELLALVEDLVKANLQPVMRRLIDWYSSGKDATRILYEVLQLLRDLFIVKLSGETPERFSSKYTEVAQACPEDWLLDAMQKLGEVYMSLRYVDQPRIALEAALLGLVPRKSGMSQGQQLTAAEATATPQAPQVSRVPQASATGQVAQQAPQASQAAVPGTPQPHVASQDGASSQSTDGQPGMASTSVAPNAQSIGQPSSSQSTEDGSAGVNTKPSSASPSSGSTTPAPQTPATQPSRRSSAKTSGNRKLEVLRQLAEASTEAYLQEVQNAWEDVLTAVKNERITTHAWLINGDPVLATGDTMVLAFTSRIHRDAVMKQEERGLIEQVLMNQFGRPMQVLALLKSDWQAFQDTLAESETKNGTAAETDTVDLVSQAIAVFGRDLVEVKEKE